MPTYRAPRRDIQFVIHEVLAMAEHYKTMPGGEDMDAEMIDAILEEAAKFSENVLAPINASGDEQGCSWNDGVVTTPDGFKEAYSQYVDGGWPSLSLDPEFGGQGLPESLGTMISEINGTANWSWSMYPGLSHGAMNTIATHGTDQQKKHYLMPLVEGRWTGTMCLTESHCGTDLGMLRTKAEPQADGSYAISGTKIFISAGEHDMVDNIVHIVLARLPDAPQGTKGISLFIVPKFNLNEDGCSAERNQVACGSIEHKMGIHGNATCVMNFDQAKGYLIGPANKGLNCMFTFMNTARIGTAVQGLCSAEGAFQGALEYTKERLQMRALTGPVAPEKAADPIIVHPDVRRMLLTAKAFAEGGRMLAYYLSQLNDTVKGSTDADKAKEAEVRLSLLTPIAKAFMTETGLESANLGMQCFGGHGYIREQGMEQIVRDARISTIYEGTTGIQAIDLVGRKTLFDQGAAMDLLMNEMLATVELAQQGSERLQSMAGELLSAIEALGQTQTYLLEGAKADINLAGSLSYNYLMLAGTICAGWQMLKAADAAEKMLQKAEADKSFCEAKLATAEFYMNQILPRYLSYASAAAGGSQSTMALEEALF